VLSIKPLLHLHEGKVEALTSVRTKKKAVERMLEVVKEESAGAPTLHMVVAHAAAPEEAQELYQMAQEQFRPAQLMLSELSPVIGTHTGPGTLGVAYLDGALLDGAV
jgi:DegV family protein with EDD domain